MCLIEGRADEIVHGAVDNDEAPGTALLHEHDAGQEVTLVADQITARLDRQPALEIADRVLHDLRILGEIRRRAAVIGNADPAAEIKMIDLVALLAKIERHAPQPVIGGAVRRDIHQLRADMHRHAAEADIFQLGREREHVRRPFDIDTELVFLAAGRDLRMGLGVDIRIDPDRRRRDHALGGGNLVEKPELVFRFDVELMNARIQSRRHLVRRLADAGENDLVRRDTGPEAALHLAAGHHIHARAQFAEQADYGKVRIGFQSVIDRDRETRERPLQGAIPRGHSGFGINVDGAAHIFGDTGERNLLNSQGAVHVGDLLTHFIKLSVG